MFNVEAKGVGFVLLSLSVGLLIGCSGTNRLELPDYPAKAGQAAIDAYDTNGDGALGGDELSQAPGLAASLSHVDADGDGRLTAEEIENRIQHWREVDIAQVGVPCEVTLDGAPLANARIEFDPEPFLGPKVKPARGTTGPTGGAAISMSAEDLDDVRFPGVACGWYKIRVTSDDQPIPARYNTDTTLGCEVALNTHWTTPGVILLQLSSQQ